MCARVARPLRHRGPRVGKNAPCPNGLLQPVRPSPDSGRSLPSTAMVCAPRRSGAFRAPHDQAVNSHDGEIIVELASGDSSPCASCRRRIALQLALGNTLRRKFAGAALSCERFEQFEDVICLDIGIAGCVGLIPPALAANSFMASANGSSERQTRLTFGFLHRDPGSNSPDDHRAHIPRRGPSCSLSA